jgi:Sugar (and other) transporter
MYVIALNCLPFTQLPSLSFTLQQWSGQNSVGYYAPQIFKSIGYSSDSAALLASGVYGVVKVVATFLFVFFLVERVGRKWSLVFSGLYHFHYRSLPLPNELIYD